MRHESGVLHTTARDERGLTLIEMMVAMVISSVVMGAVVLLFTSFMKDNSYAAYRDDAQSHAQLMVDRMSHELRSAASISAGTAGLLAQAGSYDVAFQSVSASGTAPSGNAANQQWVRYCLDTNNTLWRQTTSTSNTTSSLPDVSNCPSTSNAWAQKANGTPCCVELSDVTNRINGDDRPLFTFGPTGYSSTSQIKMVQINMYVDRNPGKLPGPTQLTSGIYLRNELTSPTALVTVSYTVGTNSTDVSLNGSASSDPNGQALDYQWYVNSAGVGCSSTSAGPATGAISGATTQTYDAGTFAHGAQKTFALVVTDTDGLTACKDTGTVTIP
jgi:prepilin-type N-terminal cleavage/methylation domain-containing protein